MSEEITEVEAARTLLLSSCGAGITIAGSAAEVWVKLVLAELGQPRGRIRSMGTRVGWGDRFPQGALVIGWLDGEVPGAVVQLLRSETDKIVPILWRLDGEVAPVNMALLTLGKDMSAAMLRVAEALGCGEQEAPLHAAQRVMRALEPFALAAPRMEGLAIVVNGDEVAVEAKAFEAAAAAYVGSPEDEPADNAEEETPEGPNAVMRAAFERYRERVQQPTPELRALYDNYVKNAPAPISRAAVTVLRATWADKQAQAVLLHQRNQERAAKAVLGVLDELLGGDHDAEV